MPGEIGRDWGLPPILLEIDCFRKINSEGPLLDPSDRDTDRSGCGCFPLW